MIERYFHPEHVLEALAAYATFAGTTQWSVSHKLKLYEKAAAAFREPSPESFQEFEDLYANLRAYWQVFRNGVSRMSAHDLYRTLCAELSRSGCKSRLDLLGLPVNEGALAEVMETLVAVKDLKQNKYMAVVTMPISKFLHFFNPKLYPIYDTAIIENQVLAYFREDWNSYSRRVNIQNLHFDFSYYLRYMCWLSDLITPHAEAVMLHFESWVKQAVQDERLSGVVPSQIGTYYALAAEFIAIGAWQAESVKGR